jgi:hypothetical protein
MTAVDRTEWTQADLMAECVRRFGQDAKQWAFVCPTCGDVATIQDFIDAGDGNKAGQECIGRLLGSPEAKRVKGRRACGPAKGHRGCNWAAFGLLRGPWKVTLPADGDKPERDVWSFALAPGGAA